MNNKSYLLRASLFIAFLCTMQITYSAELRPLNLPSAQRQYTAPVQTYAPATTLQAEPTVYDRFRAQVAGLNSTQKEEYRTTYQSSLIEARSRGDRAAETYYAELLNILNEN